MTEPTKLLSAEEFAELDVFHSEQPTNYDCAEAIAAYADALTALHEAEQARDAATKRVAELDDALNAANGRTLMVAQGLQSELEMATKFDKEIGAMYAQVAYALGWDKVEKWSWGSAIGTLTNTRAERDALAAEVAELRAALEQVRAWDSAPYRLRAIAIAALAAQPQGERGAQP